MKMTYSKLSSSCGDCGKNEIKSYKKISTPTVASSEPYSLLRMDVQNPLRQPLSTKFKPSHKETKTPYFGLPASPHQGYIKLNFDGLVRGNSSATSTVLRNEKES